MRQIKTAIVENDKLAAEKLSEYLIRWNEENRRDLTLTISTFHKGEDFIRELKSAEGGPVFQLVFMDIQLDGKLDGMETAKQLRSWGGKQILVFLTSFDTYIMEGYDVDAIKYLLKPLRYQDLKAAVDKAVLRMGGESYLYQGKGETRWIAYEDIFYFQSSLHYVDIITAEETLRQKCTLRDVEKQLPPYFLRCHRVNIVNMHQVDSICREDILLKNRERLRISSTYRDLIEKFMFRDAF